MECLLCVEQIEQKKNVYKTSCGHMYHSSCIYKHINKNRKDCPLCRKELDIYNIPSIYYDILEQPLVKKQIESYFNFKEEYDINHPIKKSIDSIYSFENKYHNINILVEKDLDQLIANGEVFETFSHDSVVGFKFKNKNVLFQPPSVKCIMNGNHLKVIDSDTQFDIYMTKVKKLINYEDINFSKNFILPTSEHIFNKYKKPIQNKLPQIQVFDAMLLIEFVIINKDGKNLAYNKLFQLGMK
uniref:RING-type domain-containing protein n=1 Tax=viral metagenome TaxID=1070528 RepID=A0A6C0ACY9_9ZZZZ